MNIIKMMNRFYVHDMDVALYFYEHLLGQKHSSRFKYPEINLELAAVGNILIIAGTEEALKPFRSTNATFLVDSIEEFREFLLDNGSEVISDVTKVPTGFNMTVKHKDGNVVEYVEHR